MNLLKSLKNFIFNRTIQFELMMALILIAVIPAVAISFFYYFKMNTFIEERIRAYNLEIIKQAGEKVNFLLEQVEINKRQLTAAIVTDEVFDTYNPDDQIESLSIHRSMEKLLRNTRRSFPVISDIYLLGFNNSKFSSNTNCDWERLVDKEWFKHIKESESSDITIPTHIADYRSMAFQKDEGTRVISFVKKVNEVKNGKLVGIIQIDLDYDSIKRIIENVNIGENDFIIIVDDKNNVIYSTDEKQLGSNISRINYRGMSTTNAQGFIKTGDKNGYFNIRHQLNSYGWSIIEIVSTDKFFIQFKEANQILLFIILLTVLCAVVISFVLSKGITRPITRMINIMKKVGDGQFDISVPKADNIDLQALTSSFNIMVGRINILMRNLVEKESEKLSAQYKALQAQINPHFLYNTLEVVRSIAIRHEARSIVEICKALADMFRYSISKESEVVSLDKELEHIRNYINIQKYRYGEKIDVIFDIPEEMLDYKIIKLIIQPLVENAVYHGMEMKRGKGTIIIKSKKSQSDLFIYIIDDGLGIQKENVDLINKAFDGQESIGCFSGQPGMGIGILNVNARIKLFYGSQYGLYFQCTPGVATVVRIYLPAIK